MTGSAFRAVAPVSAACAAFRTQPSAYPPSTRKPDIAPVCGSFTGTAGTERNRLRAVLSFMEHDEWVKAAVRGIPRAKRRTI